ncbi:MAG: mitochondrial fission ELM1 family protein [Kiloniellales bacterium]
MKRLSCWTLTNGGAGMVNQAIGLAEAMGLRPEPKPSRPRAPWKYLTPRLWLRPLQAGGAGSDPLAPPWPDLLVSCGGDAVAPAIAVGRLGRGRTRTIHVQDPMVRLRRFDLVVAPDHDRVTGDNMIVTLGAVGRVNRTRLAAAAEAFAPRLAHLPRPLIAVLVGGSNACYRLKPAHAASLAESLARLAQRYGAGLMISPSRRTGARNLAVLKARLEGPGVVIWDGTGENPYFGYLGLADHVVVTCDSVNMVSEACVTGKPVHVVELDGGNAKFRRFHDAMRRAGMTRPFSGDLDTWHYPAFDETARAAAEALHRLGWEHGGAPTAAAP